MWLPILLRSIPFTIPYHLPTDYLWGSFVRFSYLSAGIFFPQLVIRPTLYDARRKMEIFHSRFCVLFSLCAFYQRQWRKRKDKLKMEKIRKGTYHNIVYSSLRIAKALMKWVDRYNDPHIFISYLFVTQATNYLMVSAHPSIVFYTFDMLYVFYELFVFYSVLLFLLIKELFLIGVVWHGRFFGVAKIKDSEANINRIGRQ